MVDVIKIRWGGRIGMVAIFAFVLGAFLVGAERRLPRTEETIPLENQATPTGKTTEDMVTPVLNSPAIRPNDESILHQTASLLKLILSPILFAGLFFAFRTWMEMHQYIWGQWLYTVGIMGLIVWVISGLIRVFLIERLGNANIDTNEQPALIFMWVIASDSFLDGAYFLTALYGMIAGMVIFQQKYRWLGAFGVVNGLTVIGLLLLNPYDNLAIYFNFFYSIPLIWLFCLSAFLLLQADAVVISRQSKITPHTM